ncbi:MAG: preprotein translocase subunit SecE [Lentisphaeria bacterium]
MQNPIHLVRDWYLQVVGELRKCAWPTRQELVESTLVVIISVALLSIYVMGLDWISGAAIRLLMGTW